MMDIRQLRYFAQIVESGSLSKASKQLLIAQPGLSQQMARLEDEVGRPLLLRSARGVVPTPNGEALYHHAKFMLRQLEEATLIARRDSADVRGRVTVGMVSSTAFVVGLPLLRALKRSYPGVVLNVVTTRPALLEEMARRGDVDIAILFTRTLGRDLALEPLLVEDAFVILPGDTKLVPPGQDSLTLKETTSLPMVMSTPANLLRHRYMLELERADLEADIVAEIDSLSLIMRFLAEEGGATIQVMAATQALDRPAGWRCLSIRDARITRANNLYTLPVAKRSESVTIVRTELLRVIRHLVDTGVWQKVRISPAFDSLQAG